VGVARSFGVLGALEVRLGGRLIPVTAGRARVVLAALLLDAGRVVPAETLIGHLWDTPPRSPRTVLDSLVVWLRRAFGDHDVIRTYESGYAIEVRPGELDLDRFRDLLAEAGQAADAALERNRLRAALDLWRGPALADVPSDSLRVPAAERLQELRFTALSRWVDLGLSLGDHDGPVGELPRLMTAMHRDGRQAEALAAYEETRAEPALKRLHEAILARHPEPAVRAPWREPHRLPLPVSDFTGRDADHEVLAERLRAGASPVVVWGPAGVGKSALAVRLAHDLRAAYPDGRWYVELGSADAGEALAELLLASGVPAEEIPRDPRARESAWRARLAGRRVLLVLDDAADPEQIRPFLTGCAVIITSRRAPAALPGAYRLRELEPADAVRMLGRIAGEARVGAEPDAARRIAELCAGLPLALRIAGARLQTQADLRLARLADLLADEPHDDLAATVRPEIRLGHEGLDHAIGQAFLHMGLLSGGDFAAWTLGALTDGSDGRHLTERLVRAGLLDPVTVDAGGEPRYRSHDLVALYAGELAASADAALTRDAIGRLLRTLTSLAEATGLRTPQALEALPAGPPASEPVETSLPVVDPTWVHTERRLLLSMIEQGYRVGHHDTAARLAALIIPALAGLGGFAQLDRAVAAMHRAALERGDELFAWRAEYGRAAFALTSDLHLATTAFARCVRGFERLGADAELAYSLAGLAFARSLRDICDEESAERAVRLAGTVGLPALSALAARTLADVLAGSGRPKDAQPHYESALDHARALDAPEVESDILLRHGRCLLALGDVEGATDACDRAIALTTGDRNDNNLAWCYGLRSQIHLSTGDHDGALRAAHEARTLMTRTGDVRGNATVGLDLAAACLATGRSAEATRVLGQAILALEQIGARQAVRRAQRLLRGPDFSGVDNSC
jgi:DNA-binding SARP family transcriptional activator/tetratricopeptide (TPR) repeat protein